ncbi:hypothetical protein DMUE_5610 [Dictyocoela muelleri]|nr:hypothetical protein DMUE_5610 [Dictyocoela muelleri]
MEKIVKVFIDTGATKNFINPRIVKMLNLKIKNTQPMKIIFWNNNSASVNKVTNFKMNIKAIPHKIFNTKALITEISDDIIIGTNWLKDNNCIIDFKNNSLTIDEQITNMNNISLSNLSLK